MKATHITFENKTNRQRFNLLKNALINAGMNDMDTMILSNGKAVKRIILDGENVMYNDGYCIIECDNYCLYVDYSTQAIEKWFSGIYLDVITNI